MFGSAEAKITTLQIFAGVKLEAGVQVTSFQPADYRQPQQSIVGYLRNYSDEEQVLGLSTG